ncbi:fasciclin domain-containing protein [Alloyangia pacifica]|uniref:Uncaracterized surface protein containing fasciclin (FAS1) repeats n=1 Tax=Alloyangia pacifica TaxID=311180 RepID=A0A1I6V6J6_9RHOB|nr:fasciclin domain-containing protein [Alloyangia pacifica]SDH91774.1 Uncaracterized surface protein containing fasciclin (FAS1) repeats [Alloyangia pacifica]SFT09292.1 Uncaracterized surface protein containing fasciclin (FAS1) repeats [Alloyangia pacifica]
MIRMTSIALSTAAALIASPALADHHMEKNIVETAQEAGSFSTLLAAAEAAGLVDTLTGEGPFTVFAPTDDAFGALPEGTVDTLLLPENKDQLTSILTYHVVPGKVMSSDLTNGMMAETVQGESLEIMTEGGVTVGGVNVTQPDIEASNGVIHVIDGVLMPQ